MAAIQLNNVPLDLLRHILKVQSEMKIEKGLGQYSQEKAVLKIIKEHKEFKANPNGKTE